jgi:hypothetical protein
MCRSHDLYYAERDYGKGFLSEFRKTGDRVSEAGAVYGFLEG